MVHEPISMIFSENAKMPELTIRQLTDALVCPSPMIWPPGAVEGGVFDKEKRIVPDSLVYRSFSQVMFPPNTPPKPVETLDEPHVFLGYLVDHYGHFLLEGLARTWATEELPNLPCIWATEGSPRAWQKEICELLGFGNRMRSLKVPTRFKRLLVPDVGYRIQDVFNPKHASFLGRLGSQLEGNGPKLWLSRSRLRGKDYVENEATIEAILSQSGWTIYSPENDSISEQIRKMSRAVAIAGVEGSALHTTVLLKHPPPLMIVLRRIHNANYRTIAQRRQFTQYDIVGALSRKKSGALELKEPVSTAEQIEEIAKSFDASSTSKCDDLMSLVVYQNENRSFTPEQLQSQGQGRSFLSRLMGRMTS